MGLKYFILGFLLVAGILSLPSQSLALDRNEFVVYSVYTSLNMGYPDEISTKDYFINMGSNHGLNRGDTLYIWRKHSSYNLISQRIYKDVTFPIARVQVIHAEENASVARLQEFFPKETTPSFLPRAVMIGDYVRPIAN